MPESTAEQGQAPTSEQATAAGLEGVLGASADAGADEAAETAAENAWLSKHFPLNGVEPQRAEAEEAPAAREASSGPERGPDGRFLKKDAAEAQPAAAEQETPTEAQPSPAVAQARERLKLAKLDGAGLSDEQALAVAATLSQQETYIGRLKQDLAKQQPEGTADEKGQERAESTPGASTEAPGLEEAMRPLVEMFGEDEAKAMQGAMGAVVQPLQQRLAAADERNESLNQVNKNLSKMLDSLALQNARLGAAVKQPRLHEPEVWDAVYAKMAELAPAFKDKGYAPLIEEAEKLTRDSWPEAPEVALQRAADRDASQPTTETRRPSQARNRAQMTEEEYDDEFLRLRVDRGLSLAETERALGR